MSPIQFQKQLRLQEARRLLLADSTDVADVAFRGGDTKVNRNLVENILECLASRLE